MKTIQCQWRVIQWIVICSGGVYEKKALKTLLKRLGFRGYLKVFGIFKKNFHFPFFKKEALFCGPERRRGFILCLEVYDLFGGSNRALFRWRAYLLSSFLPQVQGLL